MTNKPPYLLSQPPINSASSLSDSALLTAFLSYAMPQDAEEVSARLWSRLGSLSAIMHAEPKELLNLGVSASAVAMFRNLLPMYGRFLRTDFPADTVFDDIETLGRYFACCFCGVNVETVYLLLLRQNKTIIDCRRVATGSVNSANLNVRSLAEAALFAGAKHVVIAHNHPGGSVTPSENDISTTLSLKNAFESIGIHFYDHLIVAGNRYIPIMLSAEGMFREEDGIIT